MKRLILIVAAISFSLLLSSTTFAGTEIMFFGSRDDGTMLRLGVFSHNLSVKLALTDMQRDQIEDILGGCREEVVVYRNGNHSPVEYERWVRTRYDDCNKRIVEILTPAQRREYRHWHGDVRHWIHDQREIRDDDRWIAREMRHDRKEDRHEEIRDEHRREHHDR